MCLTKIFSIFFSYSTDKTESPCGNPRYTQCLKCFSYLLTAVSADKTKLRYYSPGCFSAYLILIFYIGLAVVAIDINRVKGQVSSSSVLHERAVQRQCLSRSSGLLARSGPQTTAHSGVLIYKTVSNHLVTRGQPRYRKFMGQTTFIKSIFNYLSFFLSQKLLYVIPLHFFFDL